jgi:serine phosphatase RsbU (regulator of sigma subunit)/Tfp pilus assembly protein PilF
VKRIPAFLIFLFSLTGVLSAQQAMLDSMENVLKNSSADTNKVKLYVKIAGRYSFVNPDKTVEFARQGLQLSRELKFSKGLFKSYEKIFHGLQYSSKYPEAMPFLQKWLSDADSLKDDYQKAQCYNGMGLIQSQLGDYSKAIDFYFKAIKIDEARKDKESMASDYGNIALVYESLKKYTIALDYINKAMQIDKEIGDKKGYSNAIGNLSNLYDEMGDPEKALEYGLEFLKLEEEMKNKSNLAGMLSNIGSLYDELGEKDKALEYYKKSLVMAEELGNDEIILANEINIGTWHMDKKQFAIATVYFNKALGLAGQMGSKPHESECYRMLAVVYRGQNDFVKAYDYLDRYNELKDTLLNEENSKQINQMSAMYEKDKQELKIVALEKEKVLSEQVIEKQNNFRKVLVTVVVLIILLAVVLLFAFVNKRKANQLLEAQNSEIQQQKEVIEESNKNMTDSITYAKRIQEAILPAKELKYRLFPDAFVFYHPRDIVSGDFYWFAEKEGRRIIAAVDCTGHGVPGAFMSMIGIDQLNHIVLQNGITQPAEILNHLQKSIRGALKQDTNDENITKDGMDIALCTFTKNKVEYAGANRSLVLIRKNKEVEVIDANHFSIGGLQHGEEKTFTNHSVDISSGDCFYIFTDGFSDQFGGPKGKKFRVKNLKELLATISDKKMSEQEEILSKTLSDWKGKLEQVDDILIIGVRV